MIRVVCTCGRAFKAEDRHAGKRTKCPACGAGLTIGQTPATSSSGDDAEEVPSWWYPTDAPGRAATGAATTLSGSEPKSMETAVFPSGLNSKLAARPSGEATSPGPSGRVGVRVPTRPSPPIKMLLAISGGTVALAALILGVILWSSPAGPGQGGELAKRKEAESTPPPINQRDLALVNQPAPGSKTKSDPTATDGTSSGPVPTGKSSTIPPAEPKSAGEPVRARTLRMLVPAYIFPAGKGRDDWKKLMEAASQVDIVAIANPDSGPGTEARPEYTGVFAEASRRGVTLVGYVDTNYANRPLSQVKVDIKNWLRLYPQIRGFFVDRQSRDATALSYYIAVRDEARRDLPNALVITNPGIICSEAYLAHDVSDVTCVFGHFEGFDQFELPAPLKVYGPSHFAVMPYNVSAAEQMQAIIKDAFLKKVGYVYVSDAGLPNPWGKLPSYWEAEVEAVSRLQ